MNLSPDEHFDAANLCELNARWAEANEHYEKAIELSPNFVEAYDNRAGNWIELGNYARAISDYHKVLEYWPHYAVAHNALAQLYLDADDPAYVNPELAVFHAKEACRLTNEKCYESLATHARACHARHDFCNAVRLQQLAVNAANELRKIRSADRGAQIDAEIMVPELEQHLERFRQHALAHGADTRTPFTERIRSWFKVSQ